MIDFILFAVTAAVAGPAVAGDIDISPATRLRHEICYALATALIKKFGETAKVFLQDPELDHDDFQWIIPYVIATLRDLRDGLEELNLLTSDGVISMKDDERYKKIRATASGIRATYETGMSFLTQLDAILVAMQEDANDEFIRRQL